MDLNFSISQPSPFCSLCSNPLLGCFLPMVPLVSSSALEASQHQAPPKKNQRETCNGNRLNLLKGYPAQCHLIKLVLEAPFLIGFILDLGTLVAMESRVATNVCNMATLVIGFVAFLRKERYVLTVEIGLLCGFVWVEIPRNMTIMRRESHLPCFTRTPPLPVSHSSLWQCHDSLCMVHLGNQFSIPATLRSRRIRLNSRLD